MRTRVHFKGLSFYFPLICTFLFFALSFLFCETSFARTCNSGLYSSLYDVTDNLALGAELRGFYLGSSLGENFPQSEDSRQFKNNLGFGLRGVVDWYFAENFSFIFDGEWRFKYPGWDEKPLKHNDFRFKQLLLEYDPEFMRVVAGMQTLSFGSGAVLDQNAIVLNLGFRFEKINFNFWGGLVDRNSMRNAVNSIFTSYTSQTNGWKMVGDNFWENYIAGADFSFRIEDNLRLSLLYLYSGPEQKKLRTHAASFDLEAELFSNKLFALFEAILIVNNDAHVVPAVVLDLKSEIVSNLWIKAGIAVAFNCSEKELATPVMENLSWGMIQRFNLHQERVAKAGIEWKINNYFQPFADYFIVFQTDNKSAGDNFDLDSSDELDLGLQFKKDKYYKVKLAYAGMNLFNDARSSHMLYLELRVILGGQFTDQPD